MTPTVICTWYQFTALENLEGLRRHLLSVMKANRVFGTLLLADEGINGAIAGSRAGVDGVLAWLERQPQLGGIAPKESFADGIPFRRAKVKIKQEIVTLGVAGLDPRQAGTPLDAKDWNALLDADDVLLVDTRNEYEVRIGAFEGAMNPHTTHFREFPAFAERCLDPRQHNNIAMYCTGGIRCEKSTAYLKQRGFEQVFHLKGGILEYLKSVPEAESRWRGECFVFDQRVAVDHQLKRGSYAQCHACRSPISKADQRSEKYTPGASCPHCFDNTSAAARARFREREKQVALAASRDALHLGPQAMSGRG